MLKKLAPYRYSDAQKTCIREAKYDWSSQKNCIKALKNELNLYFDNNQSEKCCFCGLKYNETGRGEIEHFAPKEHVLYSKFSLHRLNLLKACQLCNSSTMKHTYDSIEIYNPIYKKCKFKIVHPYIDDPDDHFSWKYGILKVSISLKDPNDDKGKETIRLFELASEKRTTARAKQRIFEKIVEIYNLPQNIVTKISNAIK